MLINSKHIITAFILACLAWLSTPNEGYAQYYFTDPNRLGVKIGAGISSLTIDKKTYADEDVRISPQVGVYATFPMWFDWRIQLELNYRTLGSTIRGYNAIVDTLTRPIRYRTNYLELPVTVLWQSGPFYAGGGAYLSYGIRTRISGFDRPNLDGSKPSPPAINSLDYGLTGDIGFNSDTYMIGLRGNYGLAPVGSSAQFLNKANHFSAVLYIGYFL